MIISDDDLAGLGLLFMLMLLQAMSDNDLSGLLMLFIRLQLATLGSLRGCEYILLLGVALES